jgi:hypothetical protein
MKDSWWTAIGIGVLIFFAFYAGREFERGYDKGWDRGFGEGYVAAADDSYSEGYDCGWKEGYGLGVIAVFDNMLPEHWEYWCNENADLLADNDLLATVVEFYATTLLPKKSS